MKSVRRHELQTNFLADRLGTTIDSARPVAGLVLGGLAVIIVAAIGYGVYNNWTHRANSDAWTEYYLNVGSGDAEAFNTVVEMYPSSSAAPWARQTMGDNQLLRGIEALYSNRTEGEQLLKEAIESYEAVVESATEPELRSKAYFGLAQAYESLGKTDDALKYYQDVAKSGSQPSLIQMASERAAWLRTDSSKKFYDWFATIKTTPDAPPALPSNLSVPPSSPDISFPSAPPGASPAPASGTQTEIKLPEANPPAAAGQTNAAGAPALPSSVAPPALELPNSTVQPKQAPTQSPAGETKPASETKSPASETKTPASETKTPAGEAQPTKVPSPAETPSAKSPSAESPSAASPSTASPLAPKPK